MSDATEAIKLVREALTNMPDWGAYVFDRPVLLAVVAHIDKQAAEIERLKDVLLRNGFARCDIPACNCGSWHARYGLPERLQEIKDVLADADHPLSNENGNLTINALRALVADRDELRARLKESAK